MAPDNKPRELDKIVEYIKDYFWEHANKQTRGKDKNDFSCVEVEEDKSYEFIHNCLLVRLQR